MTLLKRMTTGIVIVVAVAALIAPGIAPAQTSSTTDLASAQTLLQQLQTQLATLLQELVRLLQVRLTQLLAQLHGSQPGTTLNPANFTTQITNKYVSLPIGKKLVYEGQTADGLERVEITVSGETKVIAGVTTLVIRDKVWLAGKLVEDTWDYLAQDLQGNVWYFGEDVNNYENGQVKDHDGSWLTGVNGAQPGYWVKANPQVGETYEQEHYPGVAEDKVTVISINETVTIPGFSTFTGCLKTYDWTPLDAESKENKYYCPSVAAQVKVEDLTNNETVRLLPGTGSGGSNNNNTNDDDDD